MTTLDEVISYEKRMESYTMSPLQELVKACKDIKIDSIVCSFNGGHDGGSIDSILAYRTDKKQLYSRLPTDIYTITEDQFWRILGDMYGSFAGEFTVDGTITFTAPCENHPKGLIDSEVSEYQLNYYPESYYDDGER